MTEPDLTPIEDFGGWCAKREDKAAYFGPDFPSGAKMRQYLQMSERSPDAPMIVGCSATSAMQIYVAAASHLRGVPGIVYVAGRKAPTSATRYALDLGCEVVEVRPGYLSSCRHQARLRAIEIGKTVRWDWRIAAADVMVQCANVPKDVRRVIVPVGSGLVASAILAGLSMRGQFPEVVGIAVSDMAGEKAIIDKAETFVDTFPPALPSFRLIRHPFRYDQPQHAVLPDGTVLDPFYAAKALGEVQDGDLLWVPGVRPLKAMPTPS